MLIGIYATSAAQGLRLIDHMEVNRMRLMRLAPSVIALACVSFASASAQAGQRGPHHIAPPHPPAQVHSAKEVPHPNAVPVPQRIVNNPALAARLQLLVPSGMTLASASSGFKNQGQFIAALHVSRNLNIPFSRLKAEMTGSDHDSLGQAIHELQPSANVKAAVKTAREEAKADLKAAPKADADDKKDDR
jgi:hypothetical protein